MNKCHTTRMTATLLYTCHEPLNFKHLATTLNLILEPAKLKFRVIHERPGQAAVLSCRKLHVSITANEAPLASDDFLKTLALQLNLDMQQTLRTKLENHKNTVEVTVGSGPLPHGPDGGDTSSAALLPLLAQMVVNHLLNMNPAEAVYWGATDQLMSPRSFLDMINAPLAEHPRDAGNPSPKGPTEHPPAHTSTISEQTRSKQTDGPHVQHLPSFIAPNLAETNELPKFELTDHLARRLETTKAGPKAAFIVSAATLFIAPIAGMLLLMYNFMGGARLKQTAVLAILAAAVTLTTDLLSVDQDLAQNIKSVPASIAKTAKL